MGACQAREFLAAARGDRLEAFFVVMIASGLRLGEALGLAWDDVDLSLGTLRVRRALQRVGKQLQFVEPKSERSRRVVTLPAFAIEVLQRHRETQHQERRLAGTR